MSLWDRVGNFYAKTIDAVVDPLNSDYGPLSHPGATIGAAFSAGKAGLDLNAQLSNDLYTNKYTGWLAKAALPVGDPTSPEHNIETHATGALTAAFSYAVGRPISTIAQVDTNGSFGAYLSSDAWNKAWNRSEDISAGQAIDTDVQRQFGADNGFMQAEDPFDPKLAKQRSKYFDSWQGRLSSGSIDLFLNVAVDPTVILGKAAKAAEASRNIVKAEDRADVLARAANPDIAAPAKIAKQGDKVANLITRIDNTPVGSIPKMPELERSADAGAFAQLFDSVKTSYAGDGAERRKAIADVLGTAWGDSGSMDRLTARKDFLGRQMEALSQAPAQAVHSLDLSDAQRTVVMAGKQTELDGLKNHIDDQLERMTNVLNADALPEARIAGDARGNLAYNRHLTQISRDDVSPRQLTDAQKLRSAVAGNSRIAQTMLFTGSATTPVRLVGWANRQSVGRIPTAVHIKDSVKGYEDVTRVLGTMNYTHPDIKRNLLDQFVRSPLGSDQRIEIVKKINNQITIDAGKKYGIPESDVEKVIQAGQAEHSFWKSTIGTKLYSAAPEEQNLSFYDPEDDMYHGMTKAFATSHIEEHHPVLDPQAMDKQMRKLTKNRALDKIHAPGAADTLESLGQVADGVMRTLTARWKDAALIRLAYGLRVQTDSQLRQAVHMDMAQFYLSRKQGLKGVGHFLLTDPKGNKSLKNVFKEGDIEGSVRKMWAGSQQDLPEAYRLTDDEINKTTRAILSQDGGVADLGQSLSDQTLRRQRNGNWVTRQAPAPNASFKEKQQYTEDYLRVVNQQLKNSPVAMEFVKGRSLEDVAADVRAQLVKGGPLAREYRVVGKNFSSIEDWLSHPQAAVDHYLPTTDMRNELLPGPNGGQAGMTKWDVDKHLLGKDSIVTPMQIHAEEYNVIEQSKHAAYYNGLRKKWFGIMADMPETILARSPVFWDSYRKNIKAQLDLVPEEYLTAKGADAVRASAMRQARKDMGRILYDASDASNASHTFRYISPFFTAWEDTMKKWSGLLYDNPTVLPRINQVTQAANDAGIVKDANGNKVDSRGRSIDKNGNPITDPNYHQGGQFILLPKALAGVIPGGYGEGQLRIRKDSINSVFQGDPFWLPGFGPLVQIPANKIVRDVFPKEADDPIMKYILPYGTTTDSVQAQLLPKWAKSAQGILGTNQDFSNQYSIYLAEATIDARKGNGTVDLKAVRRKTKNYFIIKALTDNVSPMSMAPDPKYQLHIDLAHEYRNDPNRADWLGDFMRDDPQFGEMAISLSANNTGITATNAAFDASKKYRQDIAADPEHGWLFVGPANQGGAFSAGVYDWQQTHEAGFGKNFRGKQNPQGALQNIQEQEGWSTWNSFMTQVNLALKSRGLLSTRQKGAEDLQFAVGAAREQLASTNPAWGDAQGQASHGGAGKLISTATDFLAKHPEARTRPDMVALQQYMTFRQQIKDALATRSNKSIQYNPDLAYALEAGARQLVDNNIGFEAMYNRVLQYDDLSDIDGSAA